jgi:hypothetical protein
MITNRLILLLPLIASFSVAASPFDGEWEVIWSCEGATGVYAERCAEGFRDFFLLDLWTTANSVCGLHVSTGHLGNRVDEGDLLDGKPTVTGSVDGDVAKVGFRSAWGATGTATIRLEGSRLHWKVLAQHEGESWLPQDAVLLKQPTPSKTESRVCTLQ